MRRLSHWNPPRGIWETETHDLFSEHSEPFSETWPTSGMTRGGVAYELPTPGLLTGDTGSSSSPILGTPRTSSANGPGNWEENPRGTRGRLEGQIDQLLRTPIAAEDDGGPLHPDVAKANRQTLRLTGQVLAQMGHLQPPLAPIALLKTPTAQLAVNGGAQHPDKRREGGHGPTLADEVEHLLPMPTKTNAYGNTQNGRGEMLLPGAAASLLAHADAFEARTSLTPASAPPPEEPSPPASGPAATPPPPEPLQPPSTGPMLLPTPTTEPTTGNGHARNLSTEVRLLPTPLTTTATGVQELERRLLPNGARTPPPSSDGSP